MRRELAGSTVVVTGATSGSGRASALAFARAAARVVVAARDAAALDEVVAEGRAGGGELLAVPTDVSSAADLHRLLAEAERAYGGVDTWVNAASLLIVGALEDTPEDELEQLVRTNVLGTALASRVALRHFRARGAGVLINVSSGLGVIVNPRVPAYVMSKFAVRGLSLSLHHATVATRRIRVCAVLPGPVDTPMFQRAANHAGRQARAIPPAISPERVAATIVSCARRPRRQVVVSWSTRAILAGLRVAPAAVERTAAVATGALVLRRRPHPDTAGGLWSWPGPTGVQGGWRRGALRARAGDAVGRARARAVSR